MGGVEAGLFWGNILELEVQGDLQLLVGGPLGLLDYVLHVYGTRKVDQQLLGHL